MGKHGGGGPANRPAQGLAERQGTRPTVERVGGAAADQAVRATVGRALTDRQLRGLAGAPGDARVSIHALTHPADLAVPVSSGRPPQRMVSGLRVAAQGSGYLIESSIVRSANGKLAIYNENIGLVPAGPRGTSPRRGIPEGAALARMGEIQRRQVDSASRLGITRLIVNAGAHDGASHAKYTWASLGYNASIPRLLRSDLPREVSGARTMRELARSAAGRAWLRDNLNALPIVMTFDARPGSQSRELLSEFRRTVRRATS